MHGSGPGTTGGDTTTPLLTKKEQQWLQPGGYNRREHSNFFMYNVNLKIFDEENFKKLLRQGSCCRHYYISITKVLANTTLVLIK